MGLSFLSSLTLDLMISMVDGYDLSSKACIIIYVIDGLRIKELILAVQM